MFVCGPLKTSVLIAARSERETAERPADVRSGEPPHRKMRAGHRPEQGWRTEVGRVTNRSRKWLIRRERVRNAMGGSPRAAQAMDGRERPPDTRPEKRTQVRFSTTCQGMRSFHRPGRRWRGDAKNTATPANTRADGNRSVVNLLNEAGGGWRAGQCVALLFPAWFLKITINPAMRKRTARETIFRRSRGNYEKFVSSF